MRRRAVRQLPLLACLLGCGCGPYAIGPPAHLLLEGPMEAGRVGSGEAAVSAETASLAYWTGEASAAVRVAPEVAADASLLFVPPPVAPGGAVMLSGGARFIPPPTGALYKQFDAGFAFGCGAISNDQSLAPFACWDHWFQGFLVGGSLGVRPARWLLLAVAGRYEFIYSQTLPLTAWGEVAVTARFNLRRFFLLLDFGALILSNPTQSGSSPYGSLSAGFTWP